MFRSRTLGDLVTYAKANPGKVNFGAPTGTLPHLTGEMLKMRAGIDIVHIPYKGAATAITDVLSGQMDMAFEPISVMVGHVREGKVIPLVVTGAERSPELPDVPTMIESGYPGFVSMSWTGIVAPAGTPPEVVAKLNRAVIDSFRSKEAADSLARLGAEPKFGTPEASARRSPPKSRNGRKPCAPPACGSTDPMPARSDGLSPAPRSSARSRSCSAFMPGLSCSWRGRGCRAPSPSRGTPSRSSSRSCSSSPHPWRTGNRRSGAPNIYAGWPQIADPQSLIFSPLHLALAALTPTPGFRQADLVTFAYLFAGSLALVLYFRDRGWHPGGAMVAALIFAFGGSAASRLQHTGQIISLAYLPIALWLLARALERASFAYGLAAGIFIGLLAIDRDQVAMLGLYVVAGYVLAFWLDGPGRLARVKATLLPLTASAALSLAIAIVPVVMSALLAANSNRPEIGFEYAGLGSLHPAHLLMLVFADLYGAADPAVEFWGPPSPVWSDTIGGGRLFLAQNMGQVYCGILRDPPDLRPGRRAGAVVGARDPVLFHRAHRERPLRAGLVHPDLPSHVRHAAGRRAVPAACGRDLHRGADDRDQHRLPGAPPAPRQRAEDAALRRRRNRSCSPASSRQRQRSPLRRVGSASPPCRSRPASPLQARELRSSHSSRAWCRRIRCSRRCW